MAALSRDVAAWESGAQIRDYFTWATARKYKANRGLAVLKTRFLKRFRTGVSVKMPSGGGSVRLTNKGQTPEDAKHMINRWFHGVARDTTYSEDVRITAMQRLVANLGPETRHSSTTEYIVPVPGPTALLTYNGPWGLLDTSAWPGFSRDMSTQDLVDGARAHPMAQGIWAATVKYFMVDHRHLFTHTVITAALCMNTFWDTGVVRVHVHGWVDLGRKKHHTTGCFKLMGSTPVLGYVALERQTKQRHSGAFYNWADKIGSLWSDGTLLPWKHYAVRDTWITNMFSTHKISAESCRSLYIRAVNNAKCNVSDLEFVMNQSREADLEAAEAAARLRIAGSFRPWRTLPQVDKWSSQFELDKDRY